MNIQFLGCAFPKAWNNKRKAILEDKLHKGIYSKYRIRNSQFCALYNDLSQYQKYLCNIHLAAEWVFQHGIRNNFWNLNEKLALFEHLWCYTQSALHRKAELIFINLIFMAMESMEALDILRLWRNIGWYNIAVHWEKSGIAV